MSNDQLAGELISIRDQSGELVAVTADDAGERRDEPLREFLRRMRKAFGVDVVFVSQFVAGRRVVRAVDCDPDDEFAVRENASDPLEESYCFHVVEQRLPQVIPDTSQVPFAMALRGTYEARVGSHLSVPIMGADGSAFGTVCCFSHEPDEAIGSQVRMETLQTIAALLAGTFGPIR